MGTVVGGPVGTCICCQQYRYDKKDFIQVRHGNLCTKCEDQLVSVLRLDTNSPLIIRPTDVETLREAIAGMEQGEVLSLTMDAMRAVEFFNLPEWDG